MSDIEARLSGRLGAFRLDVAFEAPANGVTALVGPSGCGKTTFLRCIAGLTRLSGHVAFRGQVWQQRNAFVPTHRRPVGVVFQDAGLFPHLTVRQNLAFGLRRARDERRLSLDDVVAMLGLGPLLGRSTGKLSGGERQRVALGRALLVQPQLLLLDEPLSSLDVEGKAEVAAALERALSALAIPVIYVSHDPMEVARLATRIATMREGRILGIEARPLGLGAQVAAEATLDALSPEAVRRLALAALMAGLEAPES